MTHHREYARGLLLAFLMPAVSLAAGSDRIQVRMENVNFHVGQGVELHVLYLTGRLASAAPGKIPTFDDVNSYVIEIDSARVSMTAGSLTNLMNNVLFAAPSAPIENMRVEIEGGELRQTGTLKKGISVPFTDHSPGRKPQFHVLPWWNASVWKAHHG